MPIVDHLALTVSAGCALIRYSSDNDNQVIGTTTGYVSTMALVNQSVVCVLDTSARIELKEKVADQDKLSSAINKMHFLFYHRLLF